MQLEINNSVMQIDAAEDTPLLWALRDHLGLTGTKFGCGMALCGACTVHVDGEAVRACVNADLAAVAGKKITTIEGVGATKIGKAVQDAWLALDVPQCGYCQTGPDHVRRGALAQHPQAERCRHRRRDERQHLPLRHLYPHPCRHQAGGRRSGDKP